MVALVAFASALFTEACSADITSTRATPDAGTTTADSGSVQDASVAVDASTDGGADSGTILWPSADSGASDAAPSDAAPSDAAPSDAAVDGGIGILGMAIWAGTDFVSTEVAVLGIPRPGVTPGLAGRLAIASGDVVVAASNAHAFALVRDKGIVKVLDPARPWVVTRDVILTPDAGAYADNPYDVAFVPSASKAFVARYADNGVAVFDPATGTRSTSVDLSPLMAPADTDGLVDVAQLVTDNTSGKVLALLQRIDQFDYSGNCLAANPAIAAIDPTTGQITGVSSASAAAIELDGANPQQMLLNAATRKLYVVSVGCSASDAGSLYTRRGIEEVDLTTGSHRWIVQQSGTQRLSGLLYWDGTNSYVREGSRWRPWSTSTATFGPDSAAFAATAPLMVSPTTVVNLAATAAGDAGTTWSVEATTLGTLTRANIFASPWQSVSPDATYGVGGVFIPAAPTGANAGVRPSAFTPQALRRRAPSAR
jgi:hypothetical protein